MRGFRYTEHIERPQEEVFAYMMDFSTAPRWRNMVRRIEVVGGGPVQTGSKLLFTMDVMGQSKQGVVELWCYEPPHRFGQTNTRGGVTGVLRIHPRGQWHGHDGDVYRRHQAARPYVVCAALVAEVQPDSFS
jgi:Polyketide cyclase / dehydrase and lipid transport